MKLMVMEERFAQPDGSWSEPRVVGRIGDDDAPHDWFEFPGFAKQIRVREYAPRDQQSAFDSQPVETVDESLLLAFAAEVAVYKSSNGDVGKLGLFAKSSDWVKILAALCPRQPAQPLSSGSEVRDAAPSASAATAETTEPAGTQPPPLSAELVEIVARLDELHEKATSSPDSESFEHAEQFGLLVTDAWPRISEVFCARVQAEELRACLREWMSWQRAVQELPPDGLHERSAEALKARGGKEMTKCDQCRGQGKHLGPGGWENVTCSKCGGSGEIATTERVAEPVGDEEIALKILREHGPIILDALRAITVPGGSQRDWSRQAYAAVDAFRSRRAVPEQAVPTCSRCNDTHWVETVERGRQMCTACPSPCEKCRSRMPSGGGGAYCATTPCSCGCHRTNKSAVPDQEREALDLVRMVLSEYEDSELPFAAVVSAHFKTYRRKYDVRKGKT